MNNKGFTLIELIVVMSVFMLIVAVAIAIFLSIISSQRRILAQEQMLSQVSYAMEYMSKGLRMAQKDEDGVCLVHTDSNGEVTQSFPGYMYLYTRPDSQTSVYKGIKFINASNNAACQEFFLDDGDTGNNTIKELKDSTSNNDASLLTADKYNINYFRYSINGGSGLSSEGIYGASEDNTLQPRITIIMGFELPGDETQPEIRIQTTVSQRNLNASQ
jgi:type II secretory pathway pseudopilin PulG